MRKLPIYLLIDVSESMNAAFSTVQDALCKLITAITRDPELLEKAFISVITFSDKTEQIVPLTDSLEFLLPELNTHGSRSNLGAALQYVTGCANREVIRATVERPGDWKPFLFIFSNGRADDDLDGGIRTLKTQKWEQVVVCFPDKNANLDNLKKITVDFCGRGSFFSLESADERNFASCFLFPDIDFGPDADWSKLEF